MKTLFLAMCLAMSVGCFNEGAPAGGEEKFSSTEQDLSVCSSACTAPYDGNPVACASNIYCFSDAAGAYCYNQNGTWTSVFCAAPVCNNNGVCEGSETQQNCPNDCTPPSGCNYNGVCESWEDEWNCAEDCCPYWLNKEGKQVEKGTPGAMRPPRCWEGY